MMFFLTIALALLLGTLGGGLAGRWLDRRTTNAKLAASEPMVLDPAVDEEIERAATAWAASHGRPDAAARLVADKLRLVHGLDQRRARRRMRWGRFS